MSNVIVSEHLISEASHLVRRAPSHCAELWFSPVCLPNRLPGSHLFIQELVHTETRCSSRNKEVQ